LDVEQWYRELGVAPESSDAEVKAAWRRLAARWHPDRNGSPEAMQRIQRINQALEEIRKARSAAPDVDDEDVAVAEHAADVTLEEVVGGCVRELRGEFQADCSDCAGTGLETLATACAECGATGRLRQPLWFTWMSATVECGACHGAGRTRQGCASCGATGKAPVRKYRGRVEVPPGVRAGDVVEAEARVQRGGARETVPLRVRVAVQPHDLFVAGADGTVSCEVPVDGFAWMAQRWIEVPTPHGPRQMRLRRDAVNYRIKAAGLPWLPGGACADCIVTVVPLFPEALDAQQEALVDRLVAGNSGAQGTAAGRRMAAWTQRLRRWQVR
jgi:molecular chaperone DnaJ